MYIKTHRLVSKENVYLSLNDPVSHPRQIKRVFDCFKRFPHKVKCESGHYAVLKERKIPGHVHIYIYSVKQTGK